MAFPKPQRVEKEIKGLLQQGYSFPEAAKKVLDAWEVPQDYRKVLLAGMQKRLVSKPLLVAHLKSEMIELFEKRRPHASFWESLGFVQNRWSLEDKDPAILALIRDYHIHGKKVVLNFKEQCLLNLEQPKEKTRHLKPPHVVSDPDPPHSGTHPLFREMLDDK